MEKLEILVAEDREENLAAAREYFENIKDRVIVHYATTYEDAAKEIASAKYCGTIIDNNLPEKAGEEPKPFGGKLYKLGHLDTMTPTYILTVSDHNEGHGGLGNAMLTYGSDAEVGNRAPMISYTQPKNEPGSWKFAFETLLKKEHIEAVQKLKDPETIQKIRNHVASEQYAE